MQGPFGESGKEGGRFSAQARNGRVVSLGGEAGPLLGRPRHDAAVGARYEVSTVRVEGVGEGRGRLRAESQYLASERRDGDIEAEVLC